MKYTRAQAWVSMAEAVEMRIGRGSAAAARQSNTRP